MVIYSRVQFVPRIMADERVNVGVIAVDNATGKAAVWWIRKYDRIKAFAGLLDESYLEDLRQYFEGVVARGEMSVPYLYQLHHQWQHSVQLSPPLPSLMSLDEMRGVVYGVWLVE